MHLTKAAFLTIGDMKVLTCPVPVKFCQAGGGRLVGL